MFPWNNELQCIMFCIAVLPERKLLVTGHFLYGEINKAEKSSKRKSERPDAVILHRLKYVMQATAEYGKRFCENVPTVISQVPAQVNAIAAKNKKRYRNNTEP